MANQINTNTDIQFGSFPAVRIRIQWLFMRKKLNTYFELWKGHSWWILHTIIIIMHFLPSVLRPGLEVNLATSTIFTANCWPVSLLMHLLTTLNGPLERKQTGKLESRTCWVFWWNQFQDRISNGQNNPDIWCYLMMVNEMYTSFTHRWNKLLFNPHTQNYK